MLNDAIMVKTIWSSAVVSMKAKTYSVIWGRDKKLT